MTKLDLSMVLWQFKEGKKSHTDCLTAVDAYTDALIAAKPHVSGSLEFERQKLIDCITDAMVTAQYQDEQWRDEDTACLAARKILGEDELRYVANDR